MLTNPTNPISVDKCIILVNPYSHQQKGWKRWLSIKGQVYQKLRLPVEELVIEKGTATNTLLDSFIDTDLNKFIISAGGDGSMHHLVNYLLSFEKKKLEKVLVGALGLGSSNDFLKPFTETIHGIPIRINYLGNCISHDVGMLRYLDDSDQPKQKYFIVNASLGVTATANYNFNNPGFFLKFLKKHATPAAIVYTAVNTILRHQNTSCTVDLGNWQTKINLSNVNILKLPFVSGSFFYQQKILRNDGKLGLNICYDMSRFELLNVLRKLEKGNFQSSDKKKSELIKECHFSSDSPLIFECDGETEKSKSVHISILPNALNILEN